MNENEFSSKSKKEPFVNPYQDPAQNFPKPPVHFTAKDWIFLAVSVLLAWLCFSAYGLKRFAENSSESFCASGLGAALFVTALLAAVYFRLGRSAHINRYSIFYTACTFLLGWSNFFSGDLSMYFLNAFVTLGVGVLAVFSLSGQLYRPEAGFARCAEAVGLLFTAIFRYFAAPFRALGGLMKSDRKRWGGVAIGLLCAIPLLALVLALLSSADAVFGGLFSAFGDWLERTDLLHWLFRLLRLLLTALLFCSGLYFLTQARKKPESFTPPTESEDKPRNAAPFITVMVLLCVVYLVFAVIQIVFLFGGAETAAMQGGYAQYARSGFFQLVAVAAINLGAVLLAAQWSGKCAPKSAQVLRGFSMTVLALTLIILASASYRMALYISVYALSLLRLLTLWAMLMILVGLFAAAWKLLKPDFRFFRVLLLVSLCTWTLLSLAAPRRVIAEYNVSAYISGSVAQVDLDYLTDGISRKEVLHAFYRLRESGKYPDAEVLDTRIRHAERDRAAHWTALHAYDLQNK